MGGNDYNDMFSPITAAVVRQQLGGGGGGGGDGDYKKLSNKPKINGVTLNGDMELSDLGIVPITIEEINALF